MILDSRTKRRIRGASRSRLNWLALAMAITGLVQANVDVFGEFLSPRWQGLLTLLVGILIVVLRWGTRLPLEDR